MQTLGLSDSTPKPTSRLKDLFRPDLSNEVSALTVCHSASWACFIVAIVTAALAIFINHAAFLDAGLFALIGLGLRKAFRTAAVGGFVLYILEQIANIVAGHIPSVVAIFISVILFNGIRAAYAYQRFRRPYPPLIGSGSPINSDNGREPHISFLARLGAPRKGAFVSRTSRHFLTRQTRASLPKK